VGDADLFQSIPLVLHFCIISLNFETPQAKMSKEIDETTQKRASSDNEQAAVSFSSTAPIGRENLSDQVPPHESYEGLHRWDPAATWTPEEEKKLVRKTDFILLSWLCLMVCTTLQSNDIMLTQI
jgi:hypothetical protein